MDITECDYARYLIVGSCTQSVDRDRYIRSYELAVTGCSLLPIYIIIIWYRRRTEAEIEEQSLPV